MKFDLEDRLIAYAVCNLEIVDHLPDNRGANHLGGQLVRSGTAPALMYAEAQGAESRKDFIHKMRIALKEIRESFSCQKIILRKQYLSEQSNLNFALAESNELISIFVKSIATATFNLKTKGKQPNV